MASEVQQLLKGRNTIFRSGARALHSTARGNLRRGISKAKENYGRRINNHLNSNNSRQVWRAVLHFTNYWPGLSTAEGDISLTEERNLFFAFEGGAAL